MENKNLILQMMLQEVKAVDDVCDYEIVRNEIIGSEEVGDGNIIWHINYSVNANAEIVYTLREEWDGVVLGEEVEDTFYKCNSLQKLIETHIREDRVDMELCRRICKENADLNMENIKLKLEIDNMLGYSKYLKVIKR